MTVGELNAKREAGESPFVLDVREAHELADAPYPFAVTHIPMREVPSRLGELPAGEEIVCACRSGSRSAVVVRFLLQQGLSAVNLEGGILAWADEAAKRRTQS